MQGITIAKSIELSRLVKEERMILGLTETQDRYGRIDWPKDISSWEQYREMNDKKGGGLAVIGLSHMFKENIEMKESKCKDIMNIEFEINKGKVIKIFIVYIDVKDKVRNAGIYGQLNKLMEEVGEEEKVVVMGDFNSHIGFIGEQELNYNGRIMLDFIDRWNLIMLNADDRCVGVVTRKQRGEESVLDYILISRTVYDGFGGMVVDENKLKFDLSEDWLLTVDLEMREFYDMG